MELGKSKLLNFHQPSNSCSGEVNEEDIKRTVWGNALVLREGKKRDNNKVKNNQDNAI